MEKEEQKEKISSILTGMAGVYATAAELCRHGFVASVTARNAKGVDILISSEDAKSVIAIQVKTTQSHKQSWLLNASAEEYHSSFLYYVFVALGDIDNKPIFWVVPSRHVADSVKSSHLKWAETVGKNGKKPNPSSIRVFTINDEDYKNKWDCLKPDFSGNH